MTRTATLLSGAVVPTDCPEWKHECEARAVMALPTLAARRQWLAEIEQKRGRPAAERLERTIQELWRLRR